MPTSRLEALSDGVLAVAITLLVLGLHVPSPHLRGLASQLWAEWPSFASYLVSFFVIGIVWVNHHAVVGRLTRIDRVAMFVNLVLLMFVSAIPFSTATLATYLRDGGVDQHLAAAVYGIPVLGVAVSFTVLCGWAMRRGLLGDRTRASASVMRFARGAVAISAAIGIAFVSAVAALAAHATIAAYYTFERAPADGDG